MKRAWIAVLAVVAMTTFAGVASAHNGGGGHGPGDGFRDGDNAIVGADGSIYVTSATTNSSTNTSSTTITAISPAGSVRWTATFAGGRERLVLSGSNLLSVSEADASDGSVSSTITAIATASGAVAWTKAIGGRIAGLEPFNGGTYAVVITPATTSTGTATRSLVAISDAGATLWTINV